MLTHPQSLSPTPPFLKWAGGKSRLLPQILSQLPPAGRLIEPFVGAGAVFAGSEFSGYLLADINLDLVNLYGSLAADYPGLLAGCRQLFVDRNRAQDAYLALRSEFNAAPMGPARAALFVYLNRHGFNGLCRYNRRGEFNVSWGAPATIPPLLEQVMAQWSDKLQRAEVVCADFAEVMGRAVAGDVVYADPPYAPLSERPAFVTYAPGGFGWIDQVRLAGLARELAARGVPVVISNHDTPATRELYAGARIEEASVRRSISRDVASRGVVKELLACFDAPPEFDLTSIVRAS